MRSVVIFVAVCIVAFCAFFLAVDYFQDPNHHTNMNSYRYGLGGGVLLWMLGAMLKEHRA